MTTGPSTRARLDRWCRAHPRRADDRELAKMLDAAVAILAAGVVAFLIWGGPSWL